MATDMMDVAWLQEAPPETRVRLLFLINNGDPLECCEGFVDECRNDALAAQGAIINSLKKNAIDDIDNELRKRVSSILSSEVKPVPRGTPCGEHEITKDEVDFLVFHSACKYLNIQVTIEDKGKLDVLYQKLNFSENEINTLLPLDAEKLQYVEVANCLHKETVWRIWEETNKLRNDQEIQNDTKVFDSDITLSKPQSNELKEALFFLIVRQLQIKVKINRVYTGKLVTILKNSKVDKITIDKFRCYPQSIDPRIPSGFCVIFSVLENRKGADVEIKKVSETFKNLGFVVHEKIDPRLEDIENMKNELNKPKYMFYSSLVCWFISHGDSQKVKLKGDSETERSNLLQKFTNLKNFNKKAKIIFMASCLGDKHVTLQWGNDVALLSPWGPLNLTNASNINQGKAYYVTTDARGVGFLDIPDSVRDITAVHSEMDRLVAYSTLESHSAYRSEEHGSVYVDRVCNLLKQEENHGRNITEVLEETAQELHQILFLNEENLSETTVKQGSRYESTLQKTFKVPIVYDQVCYNNNA